ncbi:MAG TPA: Hsp20/alpha crystallin family protein [Alphaproteobacteria bacterium]|jgi:HSP20 family protein|nr:Hsp20/alpha crystallin family protein [Alphaproteobacteria bacterium]MCB9985335.1 Hsp20/alpha crystallin family protein [Micavibrio sp.]HRK98779.1 Hsp20/alpha crystallin family protein [Alphaproteobacteria bacterium]
MSSIRDLIRWDRPANISVRQSGFAQSLASLQEEMNRLFDHVYTGAQLRLMDWDKNGSAVPAVNVSENGEGFKVKIELAGMNPDDIDVEMTGNNLVLRGEKKEEKKEEKENYLSQEISYGSFYRSIALPETADCKRAEASFKNGVLSIEIPKKAEAKEKTEKLQIKKAA